MRTNAGVWASTLVVLSACANYTSLQTAETVAKRELRFTYGMTFNRYPMDVEEETFDASGVRVVETKREYIMGPALAITGRYGASDRLELHASAWLPLGASIGLKYMLVGQREAGFVWAPGLDVSYPFRASFESRGDLRFDVYVPLHMGYRANPLVALYWTPKYVLRVSDHEPAHALGGSSGVALGESSQILLEGGLLYDAYYRSPIPTAAIAWSSRH